MIKPFRKLRVIYTTNYSPWSSYFGGGQMSTHNLAVGMAKRGHEVHVIFSKTPFENLGVPEDLPYRAHWATLYGWKSRRKNFLRPFTAYSVSRIAEKLIGSSTHPVILHANGEEAGRIHLLKKFFRFGFIATPRYSYYPGRLEGWPSFSLRDKILLHMYNWKYLTQGKVLSHADRICPPSHWATSEVLQKYKLDPSRLKTIHNSVPLEFLLHSRSEEALDGPVVYFGRLSRDKGVDLLLRAYQQLKCAKPPLWIIGKGEEKNALIRLSKQLEISGDVEFFSWKTHETLAEILTRSRISVFPSRNENFSLSVLSAMCVGVPVISTRTGGTPEIIRNGINGLLVDRENVAQLTEAMTELLRNPADAEELGRNGADYIRNSHTWDHTCGEFEEVYAEVLDQLSPSAESVTHQGPDVIAADHM